MQPLARDPAPARDETHLTATFYYHIAAPARYPAPARDPALARDPAPA